MIEIEGSLGITIEDKTIFLSGHKSLIDLDLSDNPTGIVSGSIFSRFKRASWFGEYLNRIGLSFNVTYRGKPAILMGRKAKPGILSRIFGMRHTEIYLDWNTIKLLIH